MNNVSNNSSRWNWLSFIYDPFWYLSKGLMGKGLVLLIIALITLGFGIPIIWLYCGFRGNSDSYEKIMKNRSRVNLNII